MTKKKQPLFQWGQAYDSVINRRQGSSTMEYIIIISVAVIFAGVLYTYFTENGTIKESIQQKVEQAIQGEAEIAQSSAGGSDGSNGSGKSPAKDGFLDKLFSNPLDHPLGNGTLLAGLPMFGGNVSDDFLKAGKIGGVVEPGCAAGEFCSILSPKHLYSQLSLKEPLGPSTNNYMPTSERPYGNLKDVRLTDLQLARFSHLAYSDFDDVLTPEQLTDKVQELGWEEDTYYRKYNETEGRLDHGFQVKVFANKKSRELVIAYRGSDEFYDYIGPDASLGISRYPHNVQYVLAKEFYEELSNDSDYRDYQKIQTGHSLGGHVAQYMALQNHVPTITFNGPGLNFSDSEDPLFKEFSTRKDQDQANQAGKYNNLVRNYTFNGDTIGSINQHLGESYNLDIDGEKLKIEKADDYSWGHSFYDRAGKLFTGVGDFVHSIVEWEGLPNHRVGNFTDLERKATNGSPNARMDKNFEIIFKDGENIVPR
ncbi:DUF2974 domain-containing protein [Hazenella coriacea]|uniref:DUF2974 family protein n=1 Tax=Hazenella coriacea TaxID=1179467 RepID=A0A4R3L6Y8_9BACL|nr:DUF2974 domain-containing protein [Hazenella coriacea]TCS94680.1 DUF2974 family protein [Hazenella coriacea]